MANKAYDLEKEDSRNKVLIAYEEAIGFMQDIIYFRTVQ